MGRGGGYTANGGNGAIVTATYSGFTAATPLTIIVGGGGVFVDGFGGGEVD